MSRYPQQHQSAPGGSSNLLQPQNHHHSIFSSNDTASTGVATVKITPPPSRVVELHYNFASAKEILQHSVMPVRRQEKAGDISYSIRDTRLGVCNRTDRCATCNETLERCVGHIGNVPLVLPCFHPGLLQATLRVLRTICKSCSAILLPDEYKAIWDKKIRAAQLAGDIYRISALVNEVVAEAIKCRNCYRCGAVNGAIRHIRPYRIVHFKYEGVATGSVGTGGGATSASAKTSSSSRASAAAAAAAAGGDWSSASVSVPDKTALGEGLLLQHDNADTLFRTTFGTAALLNETVHNTRSQLVEFLDPVRIRTLFANVPPQDHVLFGMQPGVALEDLVLSQLPVTPMCTRPSGLSLNGHDIRDDDITRLYLEVINCNEALRSASANQGTASTSVVHWWNDLQFRIVRLMDAGMPGYLPSQRAQQPVKSFAQRLKGKHGRFRGNLSGKRVDFSGRSVISPDPNLEIDEVAVPLRMAKSLTYPQKVFAHNLALMKRFVQNGPDTHPGALTVIQKDDGTRKDLRFHDRHAVAQRLAVGDIVERHCINGDFIIFNRQPSLHRLSMMNHRARVLPHRTLRFNECCCSPYNADFDGDEMNIHLVQTEDARAEAHTLMSTVRNIISAKHGEPVIACTQDFLTGSFLLSAMDTFLDRSQFSLLITHWMCASNSNESGGGSSSSGGGGEDFELPPPTILKPRELWTGKQVFDVLIQPRRDPNKQNSISPVNNIEMNLEAATNVYSKGSVRSRCINEGWVTFHRSHLITGRLDKKILGGGAKDGLFAQLIVVAGTEVAARVMGRIARTTSRWLSNRGFSLGLGDVAITDAVNQRKNKVIDEAFTQCTALINDRVRGKLQPLPGMTVAETLETHLNRVLSQVRATCGDEAVKLLKKNNAPLIMAQSGSKGSTLNIAQMMACVGQQTVGGKRIKHSFFDRTLPHVPRFAEDPAARGFVSSSFFNGLKPTEFYFHTIAGREGLVDTAVKTADTGYIQRRVMKACEDLSVQYDWTVRTAKKNIVQFLFGEDSLDPLLMEGGNNCPINFNAMWKNLINAEINTTTGGGMSSPLASFDNSSSETDKVKADEAVASAAATTKASSFSSSKKKGGATANTKKAADEAAKRQQQQQQQQAGEAPTPEQLEEVVTVNLAATMHKYQFTPKFREDIANFCNNTLVGRYAAARSRLGLGDDDDKNNKTTTKLTPAQRQDRCKVLQNLVPCTPALLEEFVHRCAKKYWSKRCEPGTPCGALAAQSLCEPATQMTLRTFHFAGVASMQSTQGVPRLKEIINASKTIKTPIVKAPLFVTDRMGANVAKAAVERVVLRDVTTNVSQIISPGRVFLRFTLNRPLVKKLQIELNSWTVRAKLLEFARRPLSPVRELQEKHIEIEDNDHFIVKPFREESSNVFFTLQSLRSILLNVHVHGIDSARRVLVEKIDNNNKGASSSSSSPKFQLCAETSEFSRIMTLPFVDGLRTHCNHVDSVAATLGIEAARTLIVNELKEVLGAYSMTVDVRHIQLIADVMTHRGVVLGIQNYGIQKMNSGVLTMASFERTTDHLYNACVFQRSDRSLSVSESIIVGAPVPLGTNSFGLLLNYGAKQASTTTDHQQHSSSSSAHNATKVTEDGRGDMMMRAAAIKEVPITGPVANFITTQPTSTSSDAATTGGDHHQPTSSSRVVSFRSIFERSPLTAGGPSPMMNSGAMSLNLASTSHQVKRGSAARGRSGSQTSRSNRLYSMDRARSGSYALDLSSSNN